MSTATKQDWKHMDPEYLSTWNAELKKILGNTCPQFVTGSSDIRNLRRPPLQTPVPVGLEEKDIFIKTRDGDEIRVRIYLPVGGRRSQDRFPVLVWFHGGGYCVGSVEGEEEYPRDFVQKVGGIAVSVDYRLAPEHRFPTAINDCFDAVKWTCDALDGEGSELGGLREQREVRLFLGGVSAGASMAATISILATDEPIIPRIAGVFLSVMTCMVPGSPIPANYAQMQEAVSWEQNKDSPLIGRSGVEFFSKQYRQDSSSSLSGSLLALEQTEADGKAVNLPRTYLQVCGLDPMRDYGFLWAKVLEEQGVNVRMDVYPGLPHGFWSVWNMAKFSKNRKEDSDRGWDWLLNGYGR